MKTKKSVHQYLQELIEYKTGRKRKLENMVKKESNLNKRIIARAVIKLRDDIQELKYLIGQEVD